MKNYLKWWLSGIVLIILVGLFIALWLNRSDKAVLHYKAVPADAVAVISLHPRQLVQKMGLTSEDKLGNWALLVEELGESDYLGDKIVRKFVHKPDESGIDFDSRAYLWLASEKGAAYLGVVFGLNDAKKFSSLIYPLRLGGFKERRTGGFDLLIRDGLAVGYSKSSALIILGLDDFSDAELVAAFKRTANLPDDQAFFTDDTNIASMVSAPNDMLIYGDVKKLFVLAPEFFPAGSEGFIGDLAKNIMLTVDFNDGEIVVETKQFFSKIMEKKLKDLRDTPPIAELYPFHRSTDLIASMSIALNPKVLIYPDAKKGEIPWLKRPIVDGVLWLDLLDCMKGNMLLTINHPQVSLGNDINHYLSGAQMKDNPFMKLAPEMRVSLNIDQRRWGKLLPSFLKAGLLKPMQDGFMVPALALSADIISPGFNQLYCRMVEDKLILSNHKNVLDSKELYAPSGRSLSDQHIALEATQPGIFNLMLDVHKVFSIAGVVSAPDNPMQLIGAMDKVYLHSTEDHLVLTFRMQNREVNPLRTLVPFIIRWY